MRVVLIILCIENMLEAPETQGFMVKYLANMSREQPSLLDMSQEDL
jgi:hypothetical protein